MLSVTRPQTRLLPFYPGLTGVNGSDVTRGIRVAPTAIVMYVDKDHNDAQDAHDGTNPEAPMATIQGAITKLIAHQTAQAENLKGSVIVVGGTDYAETVVIPTTAPISCTLMGYSNVGVWGPAWTSAAAAANALTIRAMGWTIAGFKFVPNSAAAGIYLDRSASGRSDLTAIVGNNFDGQWAGRYGIHSYGNPSQVLIYDNRFHELSNGGQASAAIYIDQAPDANPYEWEVVGNRFTENDNNILLDDNTCGCNVCLFENNKFIQGVSNPTAIQIDMRGGTLGENTFVGNFFDGDYSNVGGYWPNAATPGSWVGNVAEDLLEAEVADNGWTIAPPA